jgi:hypothetical protein
MFYTGGKYSSYLLYHLTKVQDLRVAALTWEIPFLSDDAHRSIQRAKAALPARTTLIVLFFPFYGF